MQDKVLKDVAMADGLPRRAYVSRDGGKIKMYAVVSSVQGFRPYGKVKKGENLSYMTG